MQKSPQKQRSKIHYSLVFCLGQSFIHFGKRLKSNSLRVVFFIILRLSLLILGYILTIKLLNNLQDKPGHWATALIYVFGWVSYEMYRLYKSRRR